MHNVYTLRGAAVRDAQGWSKYINQLIHNYVKDTEVTFASHSGVVKFDGDINAFVTILQMLKEFPFWFNIVTP
ncbi:MAG: alkyl sulfatase BDS1-like metallo-beta-lactamase superfamily hydrolase [Glaciecola sp.]|jgi:alkyl sulfatase BDS1-like metallo-beta-lactamase superfamily hydrolase